MNFYSTVRPHPSAAKSMDRRDGLLWIASIQGFYYLFTGLWPLIDAFTFQLVTGPKTDVWLVKTVGVLVSVIGAVLIMVGLRKTVNLEVSVLAIGSALGLAAIDIVYVTRGRIAPIYLLDACAELFIAAAWIYFLNRASRPTVKLRTLPSMPTSGATLGSTTSDRTAYNFVAGQIRSDHKS
jgi:dolichyl-phosphate-mannose--protein O-mannosyl transferase